MKVEVFLMKAKLPYEVKVEINPKRGPKGKMPFIQDANLTIPDSSFIIEHLIDKYSLLHFEVKDPKTRAFAHALKIMVEEHLYFSLLYSRWIDPEGFKVIRENFEGMFPLKTGGIALKLIQRSLKKQAVAQGLGRHSQEDIYKLGVKEIKVLSEVLGESAYFFEEKFTHYDASFYSFFATIFKQPISSPMKTALLESENLCRYIKRIENELG